MKQAGRPTPYLLPGLVLALALAANFLFLGHKTLWNDEAVSFYASLDGIRGVLEWTAQDVHPPFYYLTLAAWLKLGEGEAALRALSALAMSGAALFTFLAARRLFGSCTGFLAALLFLTNPTIVNWAQKARPYGLQTLLLAVALWGFVAGYLALRDQRRWLGCGLAGLFRGQGWGEAARTDLACLAYSACGGLAMLAQHQAGFFVLGCNCAALFALVRLWRAGEPGAAGRFLVNWSAGQILLIGIWALWLPFFLVQYHDHLTASGLSTHGNYLVTAGQAWSIASGLLGSATLWRLRPAVFALFMAVAALGGLRLLRDGNPDRRLVLFILLTPLLVCLFGFAFVHPVFGYVLVTFCWLLIPYCIVIAVGVMALPGRAAKLALAGVLLTTNLLGLRNYYATEHPPLDRAAAFIAAGVRAGDGFMVSMSDATRKGIGYYLRRDGKDGVLDVSVAGRGMVRSLDTALAHSRIWVILPLEEEPAVGLDSLRERFVQSADRQFGELRVYRFDRK